MDAYVVGIATASKEGSVCLSVETGVGDAREIRHGEEGVLVKDIALEEPLQQVPRHWSRRGQGGGWSGRKRTTADGGGEVFMSSAPGSLVVLLVRRRMQLLQHGRGGFGQVGVGVGVGVSRGSSMCCVASRRLVVVRSRDANVC